MRRELQPIVTLSRFLYEARFSQWSRSIQTLRARNPRADLRRHAQRARGALDFDVDNLQLLVAPVPVSGMPPRFHASVAVDTDRQNLAQRRQRRLLIGLAM